MKTKTVLLVMDAPDEATVASLRAQVAPAHLIVSDSKRVSTMVGTFQISCVVLAGETIGDAEQILRSVPLTTPIERVFSPTMEALADRLHRVIARQD